MLRVAGGGGGGGVGGGVFILPALMDDDFLWLTRLKPGSRSNYSSLPK